MEQDSEGDSGNPRGAIEVQTLQFSQDYGVGFDGKTLGEVALRFGLKIRADGQIEIPLTAEGNYRKSLLGDHTEEILELYSHIKTLEANQLIYRRSPLRWWLVSL